MPPHATCAGIAVGILGSGLKLTCIRYLNCIDVLGKTTNMKKEVNEMNHLLSIFMLDAQQ